MIQGAYDAKATSRPEGEIVADPTFRSSKMEISLSKVVLSKADLIVLLFLDSSMIISGAHL